jgi:hypothetical protein
MKRRRFLQTGMAFTSGALLSGRYFFQDQSKSTAGNFSSRQLTQGKGFYWFGYYDKLQTDPSGRYVLGMQVPFEMRPPNGDDEVRIGMIDLFDNNRWTELGPSKAWGWQQGCMLQWIPGSSDEIIWNFRDGDHFAGCIINIKTGKKRVLPKAVYALSPDGSWAIGTEFSRIQNLRPGYGYAGIPDPFESVKAPKEIGLYRINLLTGNVKMLFSMDDLASIPHNGESVKDNFHWFNHLLINTDGTRFTFLHRWRKEITERQKMATGGFVTRMVTASSNGEDMFIIDPSGFTSHFVWRDPSHICAWTRPVGSKDGFYLLEDKTGTYNQIGKDIMILNGHNTYVPRTNNEWILCDTYPQGAERLQELYLFHVPSGRKVVLGRFSETNDYKGEWRCDLHPKCTPDGKSVIFDSTHGGNGRQIYSMDISGVF